MDPKQPMSVAWSRLGADAARAFPLPLKVGMATSPLAVGVVLASRHFLDASSQWSSEPAFSASLVLLEIGAVLNNVGLVLVVFAAAMGVLALPLCTRAATTARLRPDPGLRRLLGESAATLHQIAEEIQSREADLDRLAQLATVKESEARAVLDLVDGTMRNASRAGIIATWAVGFISIAAGVLIAVLF